MAYTTAHLIVSHDRPLARAHRDEGIDSVYLSLTARNASCVLSLSGTEAEVRAVLADLVRAVDSATPRALVAEVA